MGRKLLKTLIVSFSLVVMLAAAAAASSLTILYTNDIHLRLNRLENLAKLIDDERTAEDTTLLFDVGDAWQDFRVPVYAVWGADEMVAWMNRVGYDAMAIGNHDLYWGSNRLAGLSSQANFPLLCANLSPCAGITPPFLPYVIRTIASMRVLIVGLITAEYLPYPEYPWLRYENPVNALHRVLRQTEGKADFVIALGHLPVAEAEKIAKDVPQINVFLTGHSHEVTPEPVRSGNTLILQAGAFGRYLGRLQLEIDPHTHTITKAQNTLLPTKDAPVNLDQGARKLIAVTVLSALLLLLLL